MCRYTEGETVDDLRKILDQAHAAREAALAKTRQIIQLSSKSIRATHRQEFDSATELLAKAKALGADVSESLRPYPALFYAGYLQDSLKEVVEAACLLAIIRHEELPTHTELGVEVTTYLHGLAEAASEVRRYVLDQMRKGSQQEAENLLGFMENVYDELISFDYPDGLTGGLRRTTDALRAVVERTRSDLEVTLMQRELIDALKQASNSE